MESFYESVGSWSRNPYSHALSYLCGIKGDSGFSAYDTADTVSAAWNGSEKVAIVTGAFSGLGLECARVLASHGCEVIMAGRNIEAGKQAAATIKEKHPAARLRVMHIDLSDFSNIRQFASDFKALGLPLHILLNNAGIMGCPFQLAKDGHEMQFTVNYLGSFLLTMLLLDNLKRAGTDYFKTRIVNLSSMAIWLGYPEGIRFDKIDSKEEYDDVKAYGQSKLATLLFARYLNAKLVAEGVKNTVAVAVHPGIIATNLLTNYASWHTKMISSAVFSPLRKTVEQGASTPIYCCTHDGVHGGEYYVDNNIRPSTQQAHDIQMATKLWQLSCQWTGYQ